MANIPIWPGSSSFGLLTTPTPFGFYDDDPDFQNDADKVSIWCAQRLGYPLVDVELQDRMKILDLADKKRISLLDIATASERDKEYTGSPHEYIEWLRNRVQDPDQQLLWKERSETIKKGMKFSPEKLEEKQQTYRDWKNFPPVQAVEELFKSDEEKEKIRESLLNV